MSAREAANLDALEIAEMKPQPLRYVVPGMAGLAVWATAVWPSLEIELAASNARVFVALLYLAPLVALLGGLVARSSALVIVLFLASLGLTFTVMQPLDLRVANTLPGALTLTGVVLVFVLATARWGPRREEGATIVATPLRAGADRGSRALVWYVVPRLVLLVALFLVPLHALYGEAGRAAVTANFVDRQTEALVLIHTVHLFIGVLVAYLFFLSPSINMPIELAELRQRMRRSTGEERARSARRNLILYLVAGAVLVAAFAWLRARGSA